MDDDDVGELMLGAQALVYIAMGALNSQHAFCRTQTPDIPP